MKRPVTSSLLTQSGFSLVELMISTVIGLLLISAMLAAYVASARTYQVQDAMSEVQESGRYAMTVLLTDLRQSGVGVDSDLLIEGVENDTDKIEAFELAHADNTLIITPDNVRSEIVYLPGLTTAGSDGRAYYIGNSGGNPSLYRNNAALIEGATALVMEYGVDTDGDRLVDSYQKLGAMSASDWASVISARFYLLMRSSGSGVTGQAQVLPVPFDAIDTSDRRLYQVYTATALLRNALTVKGTGG
ncbi:type IV pilus assembly protein PilW [Amphritea atlantica]|uniref:Type IV pilus assembly protein PilW n=1 Tax=Amphritea atlantica TaxID=355243 RepID=A0A1H9LMQ1_9GAMM|nr:type IV pilus assembly protein PilW [Amphritea atlantica]